MPPDRQYADALAGRLWGATSRRAYAVLDGASEQGLALKIRLSRLHYECLYSGKLSPRLQAAAPYIMELTPDAQFTRELLTGGRGRHWGFFALAAERHTLQQLRRHFRTLLRVEDEWGRKLIFRFYDPRVLRRYLPTCTAEELEQVFGPVDELVSTDSAATITVHHRADGGVKVLELAP